MREIKSSMCMYKFENEVTSLPLLWRRHLRHVTPLDQSVRSIGIYKFFFKGGGI